MLQAVLSIIDNWQIPDNRGVVRCITKCWSDHAHAYLMRVLCTRPTGT